MRRSITSATCRGAAGYDEPCSAGRETASDLRRYEAPFIRPAALNAWHRPGARAVSAIPANEQAKLKSTAAPDAAEYVGRMVGYLPERIRSAAK